jgi:23S rRNA (adenine2503-C2)-methyltransferase
VSRALFAHTREELEALVVQLGGKPFHARVVRQEVLEREVLDYGAMTSVPARVRDGLREEAPILVAEQVDAVRSRDHTTKLLLAFDGGTVETVHIPARERGSTRGATLCVSTQIGCPVACPFCASGLGGLVRNLEAHEIVEQYLRGRALGPLSRSVVMGIGEPLLNYQNLARALELVHDDLGLGARKVTVSTVGFPERLRRIAPTKPPFQLAISLHTADDAQRDELVPAMAGTPVEEVLSAGDDWFEKTGREVTYEVVLLAGETDTPAHARRLGERLAGRRCTVNLIPFNPVDETGYGRPETDAVERFQSQLQGFGVVATVRWSRGVENAAACGQLRIRREPVR